jgi:putative peptide zinc metalloprotease protein
VQRGEVLGHVLADDRLVARTVVPDADIAWLLSGVRSVSVMRPEAAGQVHAGQWDGVVPETGSVLPGAALGVQVGGRIETDPGDSEGLRTLQPIAVIDVRVPDLAVERLGARLLVRFDHGAQPLGARWLRRLQQLTLRHLGDATDVPGGR